MKVTANLNQLEELRGALVRYFEAQTGRKEVKEVLTKQAQQLAIGAKGVKGLYQEARSHAPQTRAEIRALPQRLKWRIKRKAGPVKAEIRRRLKNVGLYQSTGWLPTKLGLSARGAKAIGNRAQVFFSFQGLRPNLRLVNYSNGAAEFDAKTGYIARALSNRAKDMLEYLKNRMAKRAKEFSKPVRPRQLRFATLEEVLTGVKL